MSHEEQLDCPFCGKERHLYYNPIKQVYFCFKCGARGTGRALERAGYNVVAKDVLKRDISYRLVDGLEDPPGYRRLSDGSRNYLLERGIHAEIIDYLKEKIYDTDEGILFFFPDEEYWQVRRWSQFAPPRWENPSVAPRSAGSGVTYHLRTHYDSSRVCCVEGIGDALRVAPFGNVAATLSGRVHDSQLLALLERGYNRITFLFDKDFALSERLLLISRAGSMFERADQFGYGGASDPGCANDRELERLMNDV